MSPEVKEAVKRLLREREAAGLGKRVEDPRTLQRVAALLVDHGDPQ